MKKSLNTKVRVIDPVHKQFYNREFYLVEVAPYFTSSGEIKYWYYLSEYGHEGNRFLNIGYFGESQIEKVT